MATLTELVDEFNVDVEEHLARDLEVPVLPSGAQGDVIAVPTEFVRPPHVDETTQVPAEGVAMLRGEAMGNTHLLLAQGDVTWGPSRGTQDLGVVSVARGSVAYFAHPEHGYLGLAGPDLVERERDLPAGTLGDRRAYTVRGQIQQLNEIERVRD